MIFHYYIEFRIDLLYDLVYSKYVTVYATILYYWLVVTMDSVKEDSTPPLTVPPSHNLHTTDYVDVDSGNSIWLITVINGCVDYLF
ncbi:MAG: hypothetical protein ACRD8Z_24070 [Nitrososphaeraceae archaeon]